MNYLLIILNLFFPAFLFYQISDHGSPDNEGILLVLLFGLIPIMNIAYIVGTISDESLLGLWLQEKKRNSKNNCKMRTKLKLKLKLKLNEDYKWEFVV